MPSRCCAVRLMPGQSDLLCIAEQNSQKNCPAICAADSKNKNITRVYAVLECPNCFQYSVNTIHTILTSYKMYCVFLMLGLNFFYTYFYMHLYQCSYRAVFHTYLTFYTNKFLSFHIDMALRVIWFPRGINSAPFAKCQALHSSAGLVHCKPHLEFQWCFFSETPLSASGIFFVFGILLNGPAYKVSLQSAFSVVINWNCFSSKQ